MKLDQTTQGILSRLEVVTVGGVHHARITDGQLARPDYVKLDKAITALGGKWDRKLKAHVFTGDPCDALEAAIESGEVTTEKERGLDFFPTPVDLARRLCDAAGIKPGMRVLEPSAGEGAIALEIAKRGASVTAIEIDLLRAERCAAALNAFAGRPGQILTTITGDFMQRRSIMPLASFDAVVMNPPFSKRRDIAHVREAFEYLMPGGVLAAVMSGGIDFREDATTRAFLAWLGMAEITPLPAGTFKSAGTMVHAVTVVARKPGAR